jgi:hypothetical protein
MSNDRECVARLKCKIRNEQKSRSVLSVWKSANGSYSIAKDKDSEKYPAIGLFEALKEWGLGNAFLDFWPADSQRSGGSSRGGGSSQSQGGSTSEFGDDFGDLPF